MTNYSTVDTMVDRAEKVGHLPQMFLASVLSATECRLNL